MSDLSAIIILALEIWTLYFEKQNSFALFSCPSRILRATL